MPNNYTISKAAKEQAAAIARLINLAYEGMPDSRGWTSEGAFMDGDRIPETAVAQLLEQPGTDGFTCQAPGGDIIGFMSLEKREDHVYLGLLSVSPEVQAGGMGKHLLEFSEAYALDRGITIIRLTVVNIRPELIAWYERKGFTATGQTFPFPVAGRPKVPLHLMEMEKRLYL